MKKVLQIITLFPAILLALTMAIGTVSAEGNGNRVKVVISIEGMTCSLCVTSINQALRHTTGVISAKTSLATKQAEVIIPQDFSTQKLLAAIEQTGYTGKVDRIEKSP